MLSATLQCTATSVSSEKISLNFNFYMYEMKTFLKFGLFVFLRNAFKVL